MKVDLEWLKDYVDWSATVSEADLIESINRQLGEVEAVIDLTEKYAQAEVVLIKRIRPHPNSTKLRLIDIVTTQGMATVISADSELGVNKWAVWLPPGSTVPATWGSPRSVTVTTRVLAASQSDGFLASAAELDIASVSDRVFLIDSDSWAPIWPGGPDLDRPETATKFVDYVGFGTVLEIENKMFTHRPDCFGLIGVGREIGAIIGAEFKQPQWYRSETEIGQTTDKFLTVKIESPDNVGRLRAAVITDLKVQQSSLAVQARLAAVGLGSVNNLVDVTNYIMYITGQPTHVFDRQKLIGVSRSATNLNLIARRSTAADSLDLLNGQAIDFGDDNSQPATVIATDKVAVALGGVMGDSQTAVSLKTTEVVLEAANFNMNDIWRTTMNYGLFTAAATCFSRGQSLLATAPVSRYAAKCLAAVGGGQVVSEYDCFVRKPEPTKSIRIDLAAVNKRLGIDQPQSRSVDLLRRVGFEPEPVADNLIDISPPFWRTDIAIFADIVEEIGRLSGYENIAPVLPTRSLKPAATNQSLAFKQSLRLCLAGAGANEVLNYSFVSRQLLVDAGQDPAASFALKNPLSPDLAFYRQSLTPSLMAQALVNSRASQQPTQALFEIGFVHRRDGPVDADGLPLDQPRLGLVYQAPPQAVGAAFYSARRYADIIAASLGITFEYRLSLDSDLSRGWLDPYPAGRRATIWLESVAIGVVGQIDDCRAGFEIDPEQLSRLCRSARKPYRPLSKYPLTYQDLTLRLPTTVAYGTIYDCLKQELERINQKQGYDGWIELVSIYQPPTDQTIYQPSWRIRLQSYQKTLKTAAATVVLQQLAGAAKAHQATVVR